MKRLRYPLARPEDVLPSPQSQVLPPQTTNSVQMSTVRSPQPVSETRHRSQGMVARRREKGSARDQRRELVPVPDRVPARVRAPALRRARVPAPVLVRALDRVSAQGLALVPDRVPVQAPVLVRARAQVLAKVPLPAFRSSEELERSEQPGSAWPRLPVPEPRLGPCKRPTV